MGIRFYCPNGHKLNVKEFQAGRKGICPFCGAKIQIPSQSTRPASHGEDPHGKVKGPDPEGAMEAAEAEFLAALDTSEYIPPATGPVPATPPPTPAGSAPARPRGGAPPVAPAAQRAPMRPKTVAKEPAPAAPVRAAPAPQKAEPPAPPTPVPAAEATVQAEPTATTAEAVAVAAPQREANLPSEVFGPAEVPAPRPSGPLADPIAEAPDMIWYVRPPAGGQFGPAAGNVLRAWLAEGRLSAKTLVWREGWQDWQEAGGVFPQLRDDAAESPLEMPLGPPLSASHLIRHAKPRRLTGNQFTTIVMLVVAIVVLVAIFLLVLTGKL